jgi:hypothetical protein
MEQYNGTDELDYSPYLGDADIEAERATLVGQPIKFAVEVQYGWTMKIGGFQVHHLKGNEPNRFHRWMSHYLLGVEWIKY